MFPPINLVNPEASLFHPLEQEPASLDEIDRKHSQLKTPLITDPAMAPSTYSEFIRFLTEELSISASSIDFALRQCKNAYDPLQMVLWQYGLISLEQLDRIFDWLEST